MAASTPFSLHEDDPYGPLFIIIAGQQPDQKYFKIPQSILRFYSSWFALFTRPKQDVEVRLPGDPPDTFAMVAHCIHTRKFFFPFDETLEATMSFDKLVELWAFGETRRMPLIQNEALNLFVKKLRFSGQLPDRWCVEYIWEKTKPGGMLRKMLVEMVRAMWIPRYQSSGVWTGLVGGRSDDPEFLITMMDGLNESSKHIRVSEQMWRKLKACEWHVHAKGTVCEGAEDEILDRGRGEDDSEKGLERGGRGAHRGLGHAAQSPSYHFGY